MDFMVDLQALIESVRVNGVMGGGACEKARQVQYLGGAVRGLGEQIALGVCPSAIGAGDIGATERDSLVNGFAELNARLGNDAVVAPEGPVGTAIAAGALLDPETKKALIEFGLKILLAILAKYTG